MMLMSLALCTVIFVGLALTLRSRRKNVRLMQSRYNAWRRQRWSIHMFNGRHTLGFGYYLHRSVS